MHILFLSCLSVYAQNPAPVPSGVDAKVQEYNQKALSLINTGKGDDALPYIKLALEQKENIVSYYYLCHINATQHHWKDAIRYGEKVIQAEPGYLPVYPDLFYCYTKVGDLKKAESIADFVKKADEKNGPVMVSELELSLQNDVQAKVLLSILFLVLGIAFALPIAQMHLKILHSLQLGRMKFASLSCFFWEGLWAVSSGQSFLHARNGYGHLTRTYQHQNLLRRYACL